MQEHFDMIKIIYEQMNKLPKPERTQIGGTYYGGTQLFSSVGNHLDLLDGEPYTSYGYGCNINYDAIYGIRIGGAYKTSLVDDLKDYLNEHKEEINSAGYTIIADYGTNFSTYGIARR